MPTPFLIYGATGFVGAEIARLAVQQGLMPILAGRNTARLAALAGELNAEARCFSLDDPVAVDAALQGVGAVLHCAGPYIYTSRQMASGCLRARAHYLDITGEIPVYAALAARDEEARARQVMLLPGVGFDVVPTDCLALHLKQRLPSATRLTLAFQGQGPARMPPGTANTLVEMLPYAGKIRRDGRLVDAPPGIETRLVDFGAGPRLVTRLSWGDVFMAWYSTGIPDIEDYAALPEKMSRTMAQAARLRPLFKLPIMRRLARRAIPAGSTPEQRAQSTTHVWGEVRDAQGRTAAARLHGPEAGVVWTALCALGAVKRVLAGAAQPGFQTPARAFGADFVLECGQAAREDL